jgi:4-alpha-glucanotransferase
MLHGRASGVLFHPTSFPGSRDAVGTLGDEAYSFIDWMKSTGQTLWQVLPLNPTGFGDSPYASFSAFAGNPYMIDLDRLLQEGDLSEADLEGYKAPGYTAGRVDYGWLYQNKMGILHTAYENFRINAKGKRKAAFEKFCTANEDWLNDYALFMALKESNGGQSWDKWKKELRSHDTLSNLEQYIIKEDYEFRRYAQWVFAEQWLSLRKYANDRGISIIGDVPFFVAYDSADVWANQDLFYLDEKGHPTAVAGVPPDYFSETGQLWGNPLYKWDVMKKREYTWWVRRLRKLLELVDLVRIDHFRGFSQYWEVKAGEETAINGKWVDGPGESLFVQFKKDLGEDLPIVAEDLGLITPDVEKLRDDFDLPGMKIFEFAPWGEEKFEQDGAQFEFKVHRYLPENYPRNCLAYLGTHDNDTFEGWYSDLTKEQKAHVQSYLGETDSRVVLWATLEKLWFSDANMVIVAVQDFLGLGNEARLNTPGTCGEHNWSWRLSDMTLLTNDKISGLISDMTEKSERV